MVKVKAVIKRREDSPIIYLSNSGIEKINMVVDGKSYPIPVVKGSHFRGRFRRWLAKKILQENIEQIKKEKDFSQRFAVLTALFYSGSIVNGIEIRDNNMLKAIRDLEVADKFGKYFGYMITGLANRRSDLSIGFAVPIIEGVNDDKDIPCLAYSGQLEYVRAISTGGGNAVYDITKPLVAILVSRKAGVVDEVIDIVEDENQLKDVLDLLSVQTAKDGKADTNNIFFIEVMNTGFDLIQNIVIDTDDEKDITAILTAYRKFFRENPHIGSYFTQGYGLIEDIIIPDIEENEKALEEFIKSINLKEITDIIKFSREKIKKEKEEKEKKKNNKKGKDKEEGSEEGNVYVDEAEI